ncbi:Esa1p-associated factor [Agyrium rufum]|nr:Esa1p-associated factor [Agyrium rufum]
MAPAATPTYAYEKDEKVLCFHHELLYEAKVLDSKLSDESEKKGMPLYRVHYKGWKNTWDDWVSESRLRKLSAENKELAQNLRKDLEAQRKPAASKATAPGKKRGATDVSSVRDSEERSSVPAMGRGQKRGRDNEVEKVSNASFNSAPLAPAKEVHQEQRPARKKPRTGSSAKPQPKVPARKKSPAAEQVKRRKSTSSAQSMQSTGQASDQHYPNSSFSSPTSLPSTPSSTPFSLPISREPMFHITIARAKRVRKIQDDDGCEPPAKKKRCASSVISKWSQYTGKDAADCKRVHRKNAPLLEGINASMRTEDILMHPGHPPLLSPTISLSKKPSIRCASTKACNPTAGGPLKYPLPAKITSRTVLPRAGGIHPMHEPSVAFEEWWPSTPHFQKSAPELQDDDCSETLEEYPKDPVAVIVATIFTTSASALPSKATSIIPNQCHHNVNVQEEKQLVNIKILSQQEDAFHSRPSIRIPIPDALKAILVDDWENVTKNLLLVPLPSKTPVNAVMDAYFDEEKGKRRYGSAEADLLEEVVAGVKEYFEKALGRILLYKFERNQYYEWKKKWEGGDSELEGKNAGDVYGAEHLARLFVSLPELIAQTNMDQQAVNRLKEELTKLTLWLTKNEKKFFTAAYESPASDYAEKAAKMM